jgi:5-(carboxyamino)imidazole ribonucleotide mutase
MSVHIILGSSSDKGVAERCISLLQKLHIPYRINICSAHRTPELLSELVSSSDADIFIAIAGLSAALPGAIAALTSKPVIGVPVSSKLNLDSILSIVQMPSGVPVACVGLDSGENAAILAAEILALKNPGIANSLEKLKKERKLKVVEENNMISTEFNLK